MKNLFSIGLILFFSFTSFAQMITHSTLQYEIRNTNDKGIETKKIIPYKSYLFYSGFYEGVKDNTMILDLYKANNETETLLFQLLSKETDKEKKTTTFYAPLVDCDKNSIFYSNNETIVMLFNNKSLAMGFLNCELYLRNYTTTVEY
jgi:hypothetical protein